MDSEALLEPQPWPMRRVLVATILGVALPLALLPWAGGAILYPYYLAAPPVIALLLAPREADRNGYQILGVAVAATGASVAAVWSFVVQVRDDTSIAGALAGAVIAFLILSIVPVLVVILVSNRYPKPGGTKDAG